MFWNSLGIFFGILWEFFWNSLESNLNTVWKELICLSRFCLNGEGQEFRSLEVREASSSHFDKIDIRINFAHNKSNPLISSDLSHT